VVEFFKQASFSFLVFCYFLLPDVASADSVAVNSTTVPHLGIHHLRFAIHHPQYALLPHFHLPPFLAAFTIAKF